MTELIAGAAVSVVAGLITGCTGFGMALVGAPAFMLFLPPASVVPTVMLLSMIVILPVAWDSRTHMRLNMVGPLVAGGCLGLPLGVAALYWINDDIIRLVAGLFVALFSALMLAGWRRPIKNADRPRVLMPVGAVSGLMAGSTSIGGPPIVLFLANQQMEKKAFRANMVGFFMTVNVFALVLLAITGLITAEVLRQMAVFLPAALLGTYGGIRLVRHLPESLFQRIVMAGVLAMGVILIVTALR